MKENFHFCRVQDLVTDSCQIKELMDNSPTYSVVQWLTFVKNKQHDIKHVLECKFMFVNNKSLPTWSAPSILTFLSYPDNLVTHGLTGQEKIT